MKLQFITSYSTDYTSFDDCFDIDVLREPTADEAKAIEAYIYDKLAEHEEEYDNRDSFDYYEAAYEAVQKYVGVAENKVVKTIYIL